MRRLIALVALSLPALAVGCGSDDKDDTTVVETRTVTETTTPAQTTDTTEQETTETDPQATTPEDGGGCTDDSGNEVEILSGGVDCATAKEAAGDYDLQGERVQSIGEWTCEGGNAQTRPVLFTCTGPNGEFVVRATSGMGGP